MKRVLNLFQEHHSKSALVTALIVCLFVLSSRMCATVYVTFSVRLSVGPSGTTSFFLAFIQY